MRFAHHERGAGIAPLIRTIRVVAITVAMVAVIAPAAQAKPLEVPSGPLRPHAAPTRSAAPATSDAGFDWTDAAISAGVVIVVGGIGVAGSRLSHRRAVHA